MESMKKQFLLFVISCLVLLYACKLWRGTGSATGSQKMAAEQAKPDLLHGGKIDTNGEYQQFCGFTIVSLCQNLELLKYLEDFIRNSQVMKKVITPLPYTSYHMTTYSIYANTRKPIKFVQEWLDADATRTSTHKRCIPVKDVYPVMKRAQQVWDETGKESFTVESGELKMWKTALVIQVSLDDNMLTEKLNKARVKWDKVFEKTTSKHPPLHVSLGYFYSNVEELSGEEREIFDQELAGLQKILPKTFTVNSPAVTSFSSMKEFIPIVK